MVSLLNRYVLIVLFVSLSLSVNAQEGADQIISEQELPVMVDSIAKLVEQHYISAEIGKEMGQYIKKQAKKGIYKKLSFDEFGKQLRTDFQTVSGDVHMSAFYNKYEERPRESLLSTKLDDYGEVTNYGYVENKILKGNIGYLKIGHFTKWKFFEEAKQMVTTSMRLLQNTDALIVDVRDNPGGFEDIVAYLVSYFYEQESFHLQEYYSRSENRGRSIRTTENVPGKRMPDLPIYVLINKNTGSAAESFAYLLKHLDRATVIGETTVGAGNGSNYYRVSDQFVIQVATWETINAITKTSWEKVGVSPNIATTSEEAYDKALALAKIEAKKQRTKAVEQYEKLLNAMEQSVEKYSANTSTESLINSFKACQLAGLINESEVNRLGYELLRSEENSATAEAVFQANTILYPTSANVYDSYGEALAANGKLKSALKSYEKAVALARENGDSNLNLFIEGLERVKKQLSDKKSSKL